MDSATLGVRLAALLAVVLLLWLCCATTDQ